MTITASTTTSTLAGFMEGRNWIGHAEEARTYDGAVPLADAEELLSYPVTEAHLTATYMDDDGVSAIDVTDRKAIVRTDTNQVFGIFKNGYKIHSAVEWLLNNVGLITDGGFDVATVAITNGGARILVQAQAPDMRVATAPGAEPVEHRPWISAATSHDGTIATTYGVGTRLLICENELSLPGFRRFIKGLENLYKVRHTSGSLSRIGEVRQALGLEFVGDQLGDEFEAEFRKLASTYVSDSQWNEFVKAYTGVDKAKEGRSKTMAENKVKVLNNLWRTDERAASWRNSAYGILAALNTAQQYEFGADKGRTERNLNNVITGKREQFDANILRMLETV